MEKRERKPLMVGRLGNVIYWACSGIAVLVIIAAAWIAIFVILRDSPDAPWGYFDMALVALGGLVLWLIGRAAKYVLAGR
jgi:hypothetical protein